MPDQEQQETAEAAETETAATEPQETDAKPKPTETVEFWKAKAREQEKRAKDNAKAAERLSEIEEAQKSEAEKAADRIRDLEQQLNEANRSSLRFKVASKYGIGDEDADLFLTGSDEETLTKQAQRLADRQEAAGKPRAPQPDPNQGRGNNAPANTADQFAAALGAALDR